MLVDRDLPGFTTIYRFTRRKQTVASCRQVIGAFQATTSGTSKNKSVSPVSWPAAVNMACAWPR
jgi:hypothetical protein